MRDDFLKNFCCPECHAGLTEEDNVLFCASCNKRYKIANGIPDFREKDEYWCNVSREKMKELNNLARESKDWLSAAKRILHKYLSNFILFDRADCQFLWPAAEDSKILDAGSMWGGIAIPAAQYHGQVYAIDKTMETLEFLDIRSEQMGFNNIRCAAASVRNLPFPDNFFDVAVLNGVLEWVPLEEDIVLESQWQKTGRGLVIKNGKKYPKTPGEMQVEALREIRRVLKPGGALYLAIENRVGYIYFAGWPDEHMNIPFICFLPRFLANFITKIFLKTEYRTYLYSIPGCRSLLKKGGFSRTKFYGAFHHYINPTEVIPFELISSLRKRISARGRWQLKMLSRIAASGIIPSSLLKYLSPSIICLALKGQKADHEPRIKQLFRQAGLISGPCPDFEAVKWVSRDGNAWVNYLVYDGSSKVPAYFCKICREKKLADLLRAEAENLKMAAGFFEGRDSASKIYPPAYSGQIGGVEFLVTRYFPGIPADKSLWSDFKIISPKYLNIKSEFLGRLLHALNKYATSRWLDKISPVMEKSICFLNDFQKTTIQGRADARYVSGAISGWTGKLKEKDLLDARGLATASEVQEKIGALNGILAPLCMQHGDYDLCNMLSDGGKINVIDFEHSEKTGLPFFDLANLLFNPLLTQWKEIGNGANLKEFAEAHGWSPKIRGWLKYYSEISGVRADILNFLPSLAALEQNCKEYPSSRNAASYPMYGKDSLKQMLEWQIWQ